MSQEYKELIIFSIFVGVILLLFLVFRIKCVKCGHKGMLKEKHGRLYCEKCGFDYGYSDE